MNVLLTRDHELRSGWKFAAYALLFLVLLIGAVFATGLIFDTDSAPEDQLTALALQAVVFFIPAAGALAVMARFVEHRPLWHFGVALHEKWPNDLGFGFFVGLGMLVVLAAGSFAFGTLAVAWTGSNATAPELTVTVLVLLASAANEELMFRGYPLQVLMRGIGAWPAMVITSLIFGGVHASNPNASPLGTVNTFLAGLMLSLAYVKTRSLWLPYGIHIGWNLGLGFIMGFPLSGIDIASVWSSSATGPELILGGSYGPEGGLLATFIFIGAAVTIRAAGAVDISPRMRAVLAGGLREK